ncbi:14164_t:CDS:1, partial [Dentiscutata heterogama]
YAGSKKWVVSIVPVQPNKPTINETRMYDTISRDGELLCETVLDQLC